MIFQNSGLQKTFFITTGVLCAVLQVGVAPHMSILNGHPNFALIFAGCAMATLPPLPSVLCGFFAGVFFDLVGAGPFGLMAFCLTLMNFLCGLDSAKRMGESWRASYRLFCICAACVEFAAFIGEVIAGDIFSLSAVLTAFLPAVVWDCLCALPFFFILGRLTPTASSVEGSVGASKYADKNYTLGASVGAPLGTGAFVSSASEGGTPVGKIARKRSSKRVGHKSVNWGGLKKSTLSFSGSAGRPGGKIVVKRDGRRKGSGLRFKKGTQKGA